MVHQQRFLLILLLQFSSLFDEGQGQDNGGNSSIFVRLSDQNSGSTSNNTMEGRLEIYYNGVWGTVCGYYFGDGVASVVCASLGFGRTGRAIENIYGPGNGLSLLEYVQCNGNELSIADCEHSSWGSYDYCSIGYLAIRCSNSSIFARLFDPNSAATNNETMEGRLEIYYYGVWGTVCDNTGPDIDTTAPVVCASLGFGRAGRFIRNSYGPSNGNISSSYKFYCNGDELRIADCPHSVWGSDNTCRFGYVAISCSNSSIFTRLFNPSSTTTSNNTKEGRLEIYFNGVWGTVCGDSFSDAAARVVCDSLGFGRIGRLIHNSYGQGNRTILFDYVSCNGNERSITDCSQIRLSSNSSCNDEDVAISCKIVTDATNFPVSKTILPHTTSKPTTTLGTTSKSSTSVVTASKPVVTTNDALRSVTSFVTATTSINSLVSTLQSTARAAITSKPATSLVTGPNLELTARIMTTPKPTIPITNSQKVTTPKSGRVTSKVMTGEVNTFRLTHPQATVTAVEVASRELSTMYDVSSVSTTLKSTTIELSTCETLPCVNGICFIDNKTASCACITGYRGRLCDENIAECDSDPCQHESMCIDGLNSYQCQCLGGYTGKNCETDVNECESNPCPINSTCKGSINRYQCLCPNPDQFIGIHCNMAVPSPEQPDFPEIVETSPKYGPMSGGTKIRITGRNLDKYGGIFFVYVGNIKLPIKNWTSSWSEFSVVTPAGESSMVFQDQKLTFEITGGKNISSDFIFTYQPDPEIEYIAPTEHLASGGTTLTIFGNNLNSSASPYLRVILSTTKPGYRNKNITTINGPKCDAASSNEIYCLMPPVNIEGDTVVNQPVKGRRRRRDDNTQNTTTYLTLALISDGAQDSPNETIEFIAYQGVLDPVTGPIYFNPADDPYIHIKGRDLNIGIGADDYEIFVGTGVCTNITLTAYELSCRPPTENPDLGSDQAIYCSASGGLPVIIFAGRNVDNGNRTKLNWSCLIYPSSTFPWWIVGVICGVSGLLLAFAIVCFVGWRCRSKGLPRASKQPAFSARYQAGYKFGPAKPDWTDFRLLRKGN